MTVKPVRLRDFVEDEDGWLYAVSNYDNTERVGCVLRYIPDPNGERVDPAGRRYRKLDFEEAFSIIGREKPEYLDVVHRVPHKNIRRILKPEEEMAVIARRDPRVRRLSELLQFPKNMAGCTGSLLLGLDAEESDIDLVVYGRAWFDAQKRLEQAITKGTIDGLSEEMWQKVYAKRIPEISFDVFLAHELRKWNRGEISGTYFDLLYTRSYDNLDTLPTAKGEVIGTRKIEAEVTEASLAFDNPAVYEIDHDEIKRVLSFTHTYSGQALPGEIIEARGICERHGDELWLIVGTSREPKGEYIVSKTLLEQQ